MAIVEAHQITKNLLVINPDYETKSKYITAAHNLFKVSLCNSTFVNKSLTLLKQYLLDKLFHSTQKIRSINFAMGNNNHLVKSHPKKVLISRNLEKEF